MLEANKLNITPETNLAWLLKACFKTHVDTSIVFVASVSLSLARKTSWNSARAFFDARRTFLKHSSFFMKMNNSAACRHVIYTKCDCLIRPPREIASMKDFPSWIAFSDSRPCARLTVKLSPFSENCRWQSLHLLSIYILLLSVCVSVRYRFSRQPLNRLLWNLAGVFDVVSERQLSILVSNGCIINDLSHKLCVGRSVTSDRYKKPKLRRHNALVSLHFNPTSNIWRQKHWTNWRAAGGERRVINCHASTVFNGRAQLVYILLLSVCMFVRYRFSRQPLNRLLWNLARVFDMMSERQLSILVSNGCIINDLLHKLCDNSLIMHPLDTKMLSCLSDIISKTRAKFQNKRFSGCRKKR